MSVELGKGAWSVAGMAAGHAMVTTGKLSRWVDLRKWPGKLLPLRDENVQAVCEGATLVTARPSGGATLADARVWTWSAPDKKRTAIELPRAGWRAIGMHAGTLCVANNHVMTVAGNVIADGGDAPLAAFAGDLVCCGGRVFRSLVVVDDLPKQITSVIGTADGLVAVGGNRLVEIAGRHWEETRLKIQVTTVMVYEDALLLGDGRRYWRYDGATAVPFDLGVPEVTTLIAAPSGLVALIGSSLVRLRI